MSARRFSLISALLMTAALLYILPWLWRATAPADTNRMDERLRPARARTLTVWVTKGEDEKLLSAACAAFERANEGVRVFLRAVGEEEWTSPDAVMPDVALFTTGSIVTPEKLLLPLSDAEGLVEGADSIGMSGGVRYAVPLWFSPNVLSLPGEWFETASTPAPTSLLGGERMDAVDGRPAVIEGEALDWRTLLSPGALTLPEGVALEQLMLLCPDSLRGELAALLDAPSPSDSWPSPASRGAPTPVTAGARVVTLGQHLSAAGAGEGRVACPLLPAVSERVRLAAVCREGDDASAFLRFLLQEEAQSMTLAYGLIPLTGAGDASEPVTRAFLESVREGVVLPNAFAHTLEELRALCLDAFARAADPVQTLLQLR